jgi:predicted nucleotidyltransferase
MRKSEVIQRLGEHADAIKAIGARSLYLFGSTARDEAAETSDVDLLVDDDEDGDFSAIELIRIKQDVGDLLHVDADVTTRAGLHPMVRHDIVASAERIV